VEEPPEEEGRLYHWRLAVLRAAVALFWRSVAIEVFSVDGDENFLRHNFLKIRNFEKNKILSVFHKLL
jgi:hypothetical protein